MRCLSFSPIRLARCHASKRIAMLRRAVLALPVRYREVVVLCDLEELTCRRR